VGERVERIESRRAAADLEKFRRFGNPAAEFAALAVLVDIAPDRQGLVFAPQRLEQTGGGPEPRIERLVDVMFFENVCRDERQLVNRPSEFRGHASRSNEHEANSGDGGRNLRPACPRRADGGRRVGSDVMNASASCRPRGVDYV
jgi:hypothetical protein